MSTFTNKSTVELIPQDEINSDFGVLRFRSASFDNFDKSKYQNFDGTPNELAVKKIYECLVKKHRSVFFGSSVMIERYFPLETSSFTKEEWFGYAKSGIITDNRTGVQYREHYFTIYLALKILYFADFFCEILGEHAISQITQQVKTQYPACYKALQMLPKESVKDAEISLLEEQRTKFISFKAQLPIFIARQLYRHRGINFTERSGRYTAENTMFYAPNNWRKAPKKATQGSIENEFVPEYEYSFNKYHDFNYTNTVNLTNEWFQGSISNNKQEAICKEQARMILPQSQMTTTINTVDLYTLSSILSQRLDKHAQKEIRDVAQQLYDISCQEFTKELVDKLVDIQNRLVF